MRCRRTNITLEGPGPTFSPVNPWSIYVIAPIMVEIFLGISNSGQGMCMEETLPNRVPEVQESKIAMSVEPLGRGFTSKLLRVCMGEGQHFHAVMDK